jgi:hypothetical protein
MLRDTLLAVLSLASLAMGVVLLLHGRLPTKWGRRGAWRRRSRLEKAVLKADAQGKSGPDFTLYKHASAWTCFPETADAQAHLKANFREAQWVGRALVVDSRHVDRLVESLQAAGFRVRVA